ncbi:MAG: hypothetical protein AB7F43_12825 [Bacteriovoracia bacterium]
MRKYRIVLPVLFCLSLFSFQNCGNSYQDYANENGRQIVIDRANNYLTAGDCDSAIETLIPLYNSQYVDNSVRMVMASAYGCKGGIHFPNIITALTEISGSDIWSPIISANYSTGESDGKIAALLLATHVIRQTASITGSLDANLRDDDANTYMVFIQLNVLAAILAPLGGANSTTGKKTITGFAATSSTTEQCRTTNAFSDLVDSINNLNATGKFSKVKDTITNLCTSVFAGSCPTTRRYDDCVAADYVSGQGILNYIDSNQWST